MSDTPLVSLVCCDLLGAAALDGSALERAFAEAIAAQGVVTGTKAYVRAMVQFDRARSSPPADIMHSLFPEEPVRAQAASLAFLQNGEHFLRDGKLRLVANRCTLFCG